MAPEVESNELRQRRPQASKFESNRKVNNLTRPKYSYELDNVTHPFIATMGWGEDKNSITFKNINQFKKNLTSSPISVGNNITRHNDLETTKKRAGFPLILKCVHQRKFQLHAKTLKFLDK